MKGYGRAVRKIVTEAGCRLLRQGRSDHEIWISPRPHQPFTVPVTIASRHTANKVLKEAGLPEAF